MPVQPLNRLPVTQPMLVYRFVHIADVDDAELPQEFLSDRQRGEEPFTRRERRHAELLDGMSAYATPDGAHEQWLVCAKIAAERQEPVAKGDYIAEVELTPDQGFLMEDIGEPFDHVTIWGDPNRLAQATRRIYPADSPTT